MNSSLENLSLFLGCWTWKSETTTTDFRADRRTDRQRIKATNDWLPCQGWQCECIRGRRRSKRELKSPKRRRISAYLQSFTLPVGMWSTIFYSCQKQKQTWSTRSSRGIKREDERRRRNLRWGVNLEGAYKRRRRRRRRLTMNTRRWKSWGMGRRGRPNKNAFRCFWWAFFDRKIFVSLGWRRREKRSRDATNKKRGTLNDDDDGWWLESPNCIPPSLKALGCCGSSCWLLGLLLFLLLLLYSWGGCCCPLLRYRWNVEQ